MYKVFSKNGKENKQFKLVYTYLPPPIHSNYHGAKFYGNKRVDLHSTCNGISKSESNVGKRFQTTFWLVDVASTGIRVAYCALEGLRWRNDLYRLTLLDFGPKRTMRCENTTLPSLSCVIKMRWKLNAQIAILRHFYHLQCILNLSTLVVSEGNQWIQVISSYFRDGIADQVNQ